MMKKILSFALAACMVLGLTACAPTTPSTPSSTPTVETPADPSSAEPIKLSYWSTWNEAEPQGAVIKEAVAAYMLEHPNVTIEINWQGRDLSKIIGTKLSAGDKIDIFDGPTNIIMPAALEYAADLTALFDKTYDSTDGKAYKDVVLNATVDTAKTYSNPGQINGVPYQPFVQCFFYNKDHFAKAGITALPTTWEEFLDACEKLKTAGYAPLTCDDAYMCALPGYYLARAKGSEWVSKLVKENSDEMWKDPAVLEMAKAYADMAKKGYFHANTASNIFPAGQQDLANGDASMYLNATWLVNELMPVTGPDFPWGQMHFPTTPGGTGTANSANYASQVFMVNKNCANLDEAFQFTVYLTTGEWDSKLAESTFSVPAGVNSDWPAQLADAKEVFTSITEWSPWSGGIEDNGDLAASIRTGFSELISGKITPEQFVTRMVEL